MDESSAEASYRLGDHQDQIEGAGSLFILSMTKEVLRDRLESLLVDNYQVLYFLTHLEHGRLGLCPYIYPIIARSNVR